MCNEIHSSYAAKIIDTTYQAGQCHWEQLQSQLHNYPLLTSFAELTSFADSPERFLSQQVCAPVYDYLSQRAPELISGLKVEIGEKDKWYSPFTIQKKVWNFGVDILAQHGHLAVEPICTAISDISKKMPSATYDALTPGNFFVLASNQHLIQEYFKQRVDQLSTPYKYYTDFRSAASNGFRGLMGASTNYLTHGKQIQGTQHLGKVAVDLSEDFIAEKIGIGLAVYGIFRMPSAKARTDVAFNQLFPSGTARGFAARRFPVSFFITKPLARFRGNPMLTVGVISYLMGMSIAKSIQDNLELEKKNPTIHSRLKNQNRHVVNSGFHLALGDSLEYWKKI